MFVTCRVMMWPPAVCTSELLHHVITKVGQAFVIGQDVAASTVCTSVLLHHVITKVGQVFVIGHDVATSTVCTSMLLHHVITSSISNFRVITSMFSGVAPCQQNLVCGMILSVMI